MKFECGTITFDRAVAKVWHGPIRAVPPFHNSSAMYARANALTLHAYRSVFSAPSVYVCPQRPCGPQGRCCL